MSRTLDSRERTDVSDHEHQAVEVALTHGRSDTETFRCQVDRFTITATNACLRLAVGTAVGLLGLRNPVDNTHEQMQPVGRAVRPFRRSHSWRNLFLLGRRVPVDSHRAGSGRN